MRQVHEIITKLESTPKRTEKEAILKSLTEIEAKAFKRVAFMAYDLSLNYHVITFNQSDDHFESITLNDALFDLENMLAGRVFTGNMAKQWVEMTYSNLSKENAEVFRRVLKRDLRCNLGPKSINKVWKDLIYIHPYERASSFSEKNLAAMSLPCFSQLKMDGMYIDIIITPDKVTYRARSGEILPFNVDYRDELLLKNTNLHNKVLHGEMVAMDENLWRLMERSKSNGYLQSDNIDPVRLRFFTWDITDLKAFESKKSTKNYVDSFAELTEVIEQLNTDYIELVESRIAETQQDIIDHFREVRERGEEGLVIKNKTKKWKNGTSKEQIKLKVIFECDLKLVGYKEGQDKYTGQLGALEYESADGLLKVSVGTGFSDKERVDLWDPERLDALIEAGTIGVVKANGVSETDKGKSLTHPRHVEIRFDKKVADDYASIKEQAESFVDALKLIKG